MTIFVGLDTETTGLSPTDDRIIEVYASIYRDRELIYEYEQRIDPQRGISAEAQRIHGIHSSDLIGMPLFKEVGPKLHAIISKANVIVWHNGEFDKEFFVQEFKRIGMTMPDRVSIDTMAEGLWATPDGKKPSLQELCFACDVEYDPAKAHAAAYDVRDTMMPAFFKAFEWGFFRLPETQQAA